MRQTCESDTPQVPPDEVQRRIEEYRRLGWQRKAPAQVVYQGEDLLCPWEDCITPIAGINFQLEKVGSQTTERLLSSWWQGPGLIGRCPGCGRYVLFGLRHKQAVTDPASTGAEVLPDDWSEKAHVVFKPA